MDCILQNAHKKTIKVAFFKGSISSRLHTFVRWWTKSTYSHAEIVLDKGHTWVSISPFLYSKVEKRTDVRECSEDWDFLEIPVSDTQLSALEDFIEETVGDGYDWFGMISSQLLPLIIKGKRKWYCSQWIAHALAHAGIFKWSKVGIYDTPDLHPGRLYDILQIISK